MKIFWHQGEESHFERLPIILDDYSESVLDTIADVVGAEGPITEGGVWYCHPSWNDYESAVVVNHNIVTAHCKKDFFLAVS